MIQLTVLLRLALYALIIGSTCSARSGLYGEGAIWSRDLMPDLGRSSRGTYHPAGITYLDHSRLILYAVTHDLGQLSSRESPQISSAFRLNAWVIEADSGDEKARTELGTRVFNTELNVTTGGILVKTGGIIKLYSPNLSRSHDLPLTLDPNGTYFTSVSASGKTIVISHYFQNDHNYITHVDVLDANTMTIRTSWDQYPPLFHFSMSDDEFATVHSGTVVLTEFGKAGRSRVVAELESLKHGCASGGAGPFVVSTDLMVLRDCKEVLLLTNKWESFSLDTFNGHGITAGQGAACTPYFGQGADKAAVASGGTRFVALALPDLKIKKPLLAESRTCLEGLQIAVYDLVLRKRVLSVKVDPLPKNDYDFALSPDGSRLAVLNDRKVSVYSVPIPSSEHTELMAPRNRAPLGAGGPSL